MRLQESLGLVYIYNITISTLNKQIEKKKKSDWQLKNKTKNRSRQNNDQKEQMRKETKKKRRKKINSTLFFFSL